MDSKNSSTKLNNQDCLTKCNYLFNRTYSWTDNGILHSDIVNLIKCYQICHLIQKNYKNDY